MAPSERRPTLTDCGCEATVYADGSGIELHYCPMHQAAPQLLEALRVAVGVWEKANSALPITKRMTFPPIWVCDAYAAIKAAEEATVTPINPKQMPVCSECRNGDHEANDIATTLVSHPNPDHANLKIRKWVCDEHLTMLADDYGNDLRIEARAATKGAGG